MGAETQAKHEAFRRMMSGYLSGMHLKTPKSMRFQIIKKQKHFLNDALLWTPWLLIYILTNRYHFTDPVELKITWLDRIIPFVPFMVPVYLSYLVCILVFIACLRDEKELNEIATFISDVGKEIPWHASQFYPTYKMNNLPRTPIATLKKARTIGYDAGLKYVYTGNIPGDEGESTYCYNCGEILIKRYGFQLATNKIKNGKCYRCNTKIDGIGL